MRAIKFFVLHHCEVRKRLDIHYHKPVFAYASYQLTNSGIPIVSIADLTASSGEIQNFGAYSLCNLIEWVPDGIPFVKVENYSEMGINWESVKYITQDVHEILWKSKLHAGDVLLSMAGTIGVATVFDEDFEANSNQAVAKIRLSNKSISPYFLAEFLNSEIGRLQTLQISNGGVQANINLGEIGTIRVPLPPGNIQDELVEQMNAARATRKAKLAEAEALLSGMDDFIYSLFGLSGPTNTRKVFAIRKDQLDTSLNPDRYRGFQIENKLPFANRVRGLGIFIDSRCAPEKVAPNEEWDWLRIDDLENRPWQVSQIRTLKGEDIAGTFFEVQEGDILIARLGPTIQNAKFVLCPPLTRRTVASCEFLVIRCNNLEKAEAALWILRTKLYREMMYARSRGATPSRFRLDSSDLAEIPFPELEPPIYKAISAEVRRRRDEARRLRLEAEREWSDARARFEAALLGDSPTLDC
jgi:hypothetical protein